jgi:hypothetical protein
MKGVRITLEKAPHRIANKGIKNFALRERTKIKNQIIGGISQ